MTPPPPPPQVPWPVDIVISSECQKIYNQVFLLLLQIKWAKYSLDTLRFSGTRSQQLQSCLNRRGEKKCIVFLFWNADFIDVAKKLEGAEVEEMKTKEPVNQQIHRMCLLRVKLMHFVNSLHNYITTRVRTWSRPLLLRNTNKINNVEYLQVFPAVKSQNVGFVVGFFFFY